jgi:hypothetical protein
MLEDPVVVREEAQGTVPKLSKKLCSHGMAPLRGYGCDFWDGTGLAFDDGDSFGRQS